MSKRGHVFQRNSGPATSGDLVLAHRRSRQIDSSALIALQAADGVVAPDQRLGVLLPEEEQIPDAQPENLGLQWFESQNSLAR
jgi:hypothetical protein